MRTLVRMPTVRRRVRFDQAYRLSLVRGSNGLDAGERVLGREHRAHRTHLSRSRWLPASAGLGAIAVSALSAGGRGRALDRRLYRAVNRGSGRVADGFFRNVTELGSLWASVGATVALGRAGRKREALDAMGAAATMWLLGQGLKKLWRRPRPYHSLQDVRLMIAEPAGTSWPSSHPAVLLAFVTVATRDLHASLSVKAAVAALAGAVGLSRIYLGVHYPADVAGGLFLGRGVADLWTAVVSPRVLGGPPSVAVPGTVTG